MRKTHLAAVALVAAMALGTPAAGINVLSSSGNTVVYLAQPFWDLEFENPLVGNETVMGHLVIEWRDADYDPADPNPYDDWSVSDPANIDGNANEIWMRQPGQSIWTTATVPSTIVSIHLVGDNNDGIAQVMVDGNEVARLDMGTTGTSQTALILVKGLPNAPHTPSK